MNRGLRESLIEFLVCGFVIPPALVAAALWVAYVWYTNTVRAGSVSIPETILVQLSAFLTAFVVGASIRRAYDAWRRIKHPQRPRRL